MKHFLRHGISLRRVLLCVSKLAMSVPHYFSHLNSHLDGECNTHGKDEKSIQKYSRKEGKATRQLGIHGRQWNYDIKMNLKTYNISV